MTGVADDRVPERAVRLGPAYTGNVGLAFGQWHDRGLAGVAGETRFRTGRISPDISVTRSRCRFDHHYRATLDYPEATVLLVFGMAGHSEFSVAGSAERCVVGPGDVWLVSTGDVPLVRRTAAGRRSEMAVVKYAAHRLDAALAGTDAPMVSGYEPMFRSLRPDREAAGWLTRLIDNPLGSPSDRLLAEGHALELLAHALRGASPAPAARKDRLSARDVRRVHEVAERLRSDLVSPPSLQALAGHAGMSHTRLNRCFRQVFGDTVFGWLRGYRLVRAKRLLEAGDMTVTEIALACGFSTPSHFAQAFRRRFGCSPGVCRGACPR